MLFKCEVLVARCVLTSLYLATGGYKLHVTWSRSGEKIPAEFFVSVNYQNNVSSQTQHDYEALLWVQYM